MKIIRFAFIATLLFVFVNNNSNAQISRDQLQLNTITTAVPFLLIAPDARAGAMGDVGVSTPADAASIHWNPAKC